MLNVYINKQVNKCLVSEKEIKQVVVRAVKILQLKKVELEVNIVGESLIKKINQSYRGIKKITDVLAFAWQEEKTVGTDFLGQIYICYPQIIRQAKSYHVNCKEEFKRMVIHGLLHLVGFDHQQPKQAKKMFTWQEKIINYESCKE